MAIDKAKLKVTLPEGFTQKGEAEVLGNSKLKVIVTCPDKDVTNARVAVKYNDKYDASVILSVKKEATLLEAKANTENALHGAKFVVVLKFDKKPELDKLTYEVPVGFVVSKRTVVSDTEVRYIFTVPNRTEDNVVLKFSYAGQEAKEIRTNIKSYPNKFLSIVSNKGLYSVGEVAEVELTFLNEVVLPADAAEVNTNNAAGAKAVGEPVAKGNKLVYKYTFGEAGEKSLTFICYKGNKDNQAARLITFNVK